MERDYLDEGLLKIIYAARFEARRIETSSVNAQRILATFVEQGENPDKGHPFGVFINLDQYGRASSIIIMKVEQIAASVSINAQAQPSAPNWAGS